MPKAPSRLYAAMTPPPHYARLLRELEASSAPLVQLWGWPGTGKRAFLAALARQETERAAVIVEAALARPAALDAVLAAAREAGRSWILLDGSVNADLRPVIERLAPEQSLIVATSIYRRDTGLHSSSMPPQELLLRESEIAALWRQRTGSAPGSSLLARLVEESEGWLRPLELAAGSPEALAGTEMPALVEVPAVRTFLRNEVLDGLEPPELEALRLLSCPAAAPAEAPLHEALESLLRGRGLLREEAERLHAPRLLSLLVGGDLRRSRSWASKPPAAAPAAKRDERPEIGIGLLGPPRLVRRFADGSEVELRWSLRRAFLTLAFLASSPALRATREELVDAIWPDADIETVRKNFHPTISLLRRALTTGRGEAADGIAAAAVEYQGGCYRLSQELRWQIDVADFRSLVAHGQQAATDEERVEAWTAAWRLYAGHYLPGHHSTWVLQRREELLRLYLEMLRELGNAQLRLGHPAEAEDALRTLLVEDPLQEEVYVSIMRIYAERGRRDLVRRQYERLCQLLLDELGVEPMAATAAEYQRLLG